MRNLISKVAILYSLALLRSDFNLRGDNMCLATVYKTNKDTEEVVLKNVSKIYVEGSQVRLVDIMGAETVVEGSISFVDLTGSVVKLNCPA